MIDRLPKQTQHVGDWSAAGGAVATFLGVLPDIAAALTVIWLGLRIWESETVREWTNRVKE
jgi:hypothetical protein